MPSIWSKERLEKFEAAWRAGEPPDQILEVLNRLPGQPFTSNKQLSDAARKRRIRRPDWYIAMLGLDGRRNWSLEQIEVLKADWPAGVLNSEIMAKLNALPGVLVTSRNQISHYADRLGLRRPLGFKSQSGYWSTERDDLIRSLYPTGIPRDEIFARLTALSGQRIDRPEHVAERARVLGVKRPPGFQSPKPRNSVKKTAPPPRPQAIPKPPRSPSRSPLKAELRVIYNHGFQLWQDGYLPVSKKNDVEAINKAIRRAIPGHPGFQLLSKWGFA